MKWLNLRSHLVSTGAADIALLALSTVTGILIARLLGPTGRGEFAIVVLWPSVIAAVGNLGIREALTYELASSHSARAQLVGTGLILAVVQSILLMLVGVLLIPWLTRSQSTLVTTASLIYLLFIPANLLAQYSLGLLQGNLDIPLFNFIRLVVNLVYLVAVLVLWLFDSVTVWTLTIGLLLANMSTALLGVVFVIARLGATLSLNLQQIGRLFHYGIRNHVGSVSNLLNQRVDQMIMAVVLSPQQLGWYTAATNISGLTRLTSGVFATLAFPKIANSMAADRTRVASLYSRVNVTATVFTGAILMLTLPLLIPLLYGQEYMPSVVPAEILTVATVFLGMGMAWAGIFRGMGLPAIPAKAELLSLSITAIGLAVLLTPLGILGAAVTSLLAYFTSSAYMYIQLGRQVGLKWAETLHPVSLTSLVSMVRQAGLSKEPI